MGASGRDGTPSSFLDEMEGGIRVFMTWLWMFLALVLGWLASAMLLRVSVHVLGDERPAFPYAMFVVLAAPLASSIVMLPLSCTLGWMLSWVSVWLGSLVMTGLGVVVEGFMLKHLLSTSLERGVAVAVIHSVLLTVVTVPLAWVSGWLG
jgi:hypothetical protein